MPIDPPCSCPPDRVNATANTPHGPARCSAGFRRHLGAAAAQETRLEPAAAPSGPVVLSAAARLVPAHPAPTALSEPLGADGWGPIVVGTPAGSPPAASAVMDSSTNETDDGGVWGDGGAGPGDGDPGATGVGPRAEHVPDQPAPPATGDLPGLATPGTGANPAAAENAHRTIARLADRVLERLMVGAVVAADGSSGEGGMGARLVLAGGPWAGARVDLVWRGRAGRPGELAVMLRAPPGSGSRPRRGGPPDMNDRDSDIGLDGLADRLRTELRRRGLPAEDVHVEGPGADQVRCG